MTMPSFLLLGDHRLILNIVAYVELTSVGVIIISKVYHILKNGASVSCSSELGYITPLINRLLRAKYISGTENCVSDPCRNGATCLERLNSFYCECVGNYTGLTCSSGGISVTSSLRCYHAPDSLYYGICYKAPSNHAIHRTLKVSTGQLCTEDVPENSDY